MVKKERFRRENTSRLFEKGPSPRRYRKPEESPVVEEPALQNVSKNYARLPRDLFKLASNDAVLTPTVLRPTNQSSCGLLEQAAEADTERDVGGNRIVSVTALCAAISAICQHHQAHVPECNTPDFRVPATGERRLGLGSSITFQCVNCKATKQVKLYEEVEEPSKPGANSPKNNLQLAAFMTKSPISYQIPPITEKHLRKKVNRVSEVCQDLNLQQMACNRQTVKQLLSHNPDKEAVDVITDTVYSNPPKGRVMSQPATQSCTPMVEGETSEHLLLSVETHSKLCREGVRCNGAHPGCSANYPVHRPMGNCEQKALDFNILQIQSDSLAISGIVTDGTASAIKGHPSIEKLHCVVHLARSQKRRVQNLTLSQEMVGTRNQKQVTNFKRVLGAALTLRCNLELYAARNKYGEGGLQYLRAVESSRNSILECFSGDHSQCQRSGVCVMWKPDAVDMSPSYLPYHQYLKMQPGDKEKLQNVVNFRMNSNTAVQQRKMSSTNPVEALHNHTVKLIPKFKTYIRNYKHRVHSAMHSYSLGDTGSLYRLAAEMKCAPVHTATQLIAMKKRAKYLHIRRQQISVKRRRRQLAKEKYAVKRFSTLGIENGPMDLDDHDY